MDMSRASSTFATAMHACSRYIHTPLTLVIFADLSSPRRLKGATDDAGINLQAAGGLHYLMANHWDVLVSPESFTNPICAHIGH